MRQLKIGKTITITSRESSSFDRYLKEVGKEEMITLEEEVELAKRIKNGDKKALEKLTRANLRFVISVAKQYQNYGVSLPDLINEGNLGLIKAAQKFDETRGFKFISYAVWWVRQSILQALAEHVRIVRLPLNQLSFLNKIRNTNSNFEQEHEREPSFTELVEELKLPKSKVDEGLRISNNHVSIDASFKGGENEETLLDVLANNDSLSPDSVLMQESLSKELERIFSILSGREKSVIKMLYGIGCEQMSCEDIGQYFELTPERVRQIKEKAIRKLRKTSKKVILKTYL